MGQKSGEDLEIHWKIYTPDFLTEKVGERNWETFLYRERKIFFAALPREEFYCYLIQF